MAWLGLHMHVKENTGFPELFNKGKATGITQHVFQRRDLKLPEPDILIIHMISYLCI